MDSERHIRLFETLSILINVRWVVVAVLTVGMLGALSSNVTLVTADIYRLGGVLAATLVANGVVWALLQGMRARPRGLIVVAALHSAVFLAYIGALLWGGNAGVFWVWGAFWAGALLLMPVVEAAFVFGVAGTAIVWIAASVGVLVFWVSSGMSGNETAAFALPAFRAVVPGTLEASDIAGVFQQLGVLFIGGGLVMAAGSFTRMRSENALIQARLRAYALLAELDEGAIFYDNRSVVRYINPAVEEILGVRRRDVVGQQMGKFGTLSFPGAENLSKVLFVPLKDSQHASVEVRRGERVVTVLQRPMMGPDGELLGSVRLIRDVTQERRVGKLKSEFISLAAHQLRTPLSGIRWSMEALQEDASIQGEARAVVAEATRTSDRVIQLVRELLDIARIEEGRYDYTFKPGDLAAVARSVVEELRPRAVQKALVLEFRSAENVPSVRMDEAKIKIVLETLMDNALTYTPAEGTVTVSVQPSDGGAAVSIVDTGVGIPKRQQDQVFAKFFRGDNVVRMDTEGTGLGLFIVRNIVEGHHGRITFESREGIGTTFTVFLPTAESSSGENHPVA